MTWESIPYMLWFLNFYIIGAISEYLRLYPLAPWSFLLAAIGILGIYLAGEFNKLGWFIGFAAQGLWIAYAIVTNQHGFIFSAIGYAWVYILNYRKWLKKQRKEEDA